MDGVDFPSLFHARLSGLVSWFDACKDYADNEVYVFDPPGSKEGKRKRSKK